MKFFSSFFFSLFTPITFVRKVYAFPFYLMTLLLFFNFKPEVLGQQTQTIPFSTPGNFNFTVPNYSGPALGPGESLLVEIEAIIVGAGGGGGRGEGAGGGGGGQVRIITFTANEGDLFTGFIGTGGAGATTANGNGFNGTATTFNGFVSNGGLGGLGGNAGSGGNSGNGNPGGAADVADGSGNQRNRAGGGGAGANGDGEDGNNPDGPSAIAGDGGSGLFGFGGGGGGSGRRNGNNNSSNDLTVQGTGRDGGGNGSISDGTDGINGGGGGAGFNSGGNGGNGLVRITITFSLLPVEYLYFDASFRRQERVVELRWATGKEWENSHFEVERAVGNVGNWEKIGRVEGQGYSDGPVEYKFKDEKPPLVGGNLYYRLKQVDFDGTFDYSAVVSVRVPALEVTKGVWRAFPNPNTGENLRVELLNSLEYEGEEVNVRIVTPAGFSKQVSGWDMDEISSDLSAVILKSPKGVYVLEIQWGRKIEHIKILKQ